MISQAQNTSNSSPVKTIEVKLETRKVRGLERWAHVGCIQEVEGDENQVFNQDVTKSCLEHCKNHGYGFAGIQNDQCRCGIPSGHRIRGVHGCVLSLGGTSKCSYSIFQPAVDF